jgi:L-aminopeptidase/D-esterase-like protein
MSAALVLPDGFEVGHWSDREGGTGCTVVLAPAGTRGGVCVHGGGPGTRETDILRPLANAQEANAVLITGGSAFGLAAADGVVQWLEEHDRGYWTPYGKVPIVPAAVVYDLPSGSGKSRPTAESGYAACDAAAAAVPERGAVGAGTGATVGKLLGRERASAGGTGFASLRTGTGFLVAAVVVVNAAGDVIDEDGSVLAGPRGEAGGGGARGRADRGDGAAAGVPGAGGEFDPGLHLHGCSARQARLLGRGACRDGWTGPGRGPRVHPG